jgi:phosphatidylglycerol:prolipoprotein diacylglycerol transferase
LPQEEYLSFIDKDGNWHPKPYEELTEQQKFEVTKGKYRCLPIHPTQLYTSAGAAVLCLILYFFWRRSQNADSSKTAGKIFTKPGSTFALMFVLYGLTRFLIEFLRDDNPFEFDSLTISQIIGIAMIFFGATLMVILQIIKPKTIKS